MIEQNSATAVGPLTDVVAVSPLVRIDRNPDGSGWTVSSGQGQRRETFRTGSPAFVAWLTDVGSLGGVRVETMAEGLSRRTGVSADDAQTLLATLMSYDVVVPDAEANDLREKAARWEHFGWRDAFDFHFAVSGTRWDRTRGVEYEDALRSLYDDVHLVGPQPPAEKCVDGARISLADALADFDRSRPDVTFADALRSARPMNVFTDLGITLAQLAKTVSEAHRVRFHRDLVLGEHWFKAHPSGGARHGVEVYVVARDVDGLSAGAYYYAAKADELVRIRERDVLAEADAACFGKGGIKTASAVLFVSYRYLRHAWKYRYSRTYRMMLLEVGHAVQTTRIAAALAGLDVYENPAIDDAAVSRMLGLPEDAEEGPIYAIGLGRGGAV